MRFTIELDDSEYELVVTSHSFQTDATREDPGENAEVCFGPHVYGSDGNGRTHRWGGLEAFHALFARIHRVSTDRAIQMIDEMALAEASERLEDLRNDFLESRMEESQYDQ